MLHQCPECGSKDIDKTEGAGIIQLCCKNCSFCWADYKNGKIEEEKITSIEITDKDPEPYQ